MTGHGGDLKGLWGFMCGAAKMVGKIRFFHDLWLAPKKATKVGELSLQIVQMVPKKPSIFNGWNVETKLWKMVGNHQTLKKLSGLRVQVREFLPPKCRNKFNLFGVGG